MTKKSTITVKDYGDGAGPFVSHGGVTWVERPPTSAELISAVGEALYGEHFDTALADALGINRRTSRRWRKGVTSPGAGAWGAVLDLVRQRGGELERLASELRKRVSGDV